MHRRVQKLLMPLMLSALPSSALAQTTPTYPFQDPSLPTVQRVNDLVGRLTLPEKVSQMQTDAAAIPRLGIPKYYWWSESLHGNAFSGLATVFPEPIGLGASFDLALESQVAAATSDENRGKYNQTVLDNKPAPFRGLTFFAPNINIFRDPRWGRGQETYGEDPYLTAQFGVTFIQGLQGSDPKYLKVVATPKHFAVHSGPEPLRHRFDAVVSDYDLYDTYLPAFQAAVQRGHAQSIMGAYSALDGVPDCASPLLLQTNLRQEWGFDGYVVSDCDAIADIYGGHHYTDSLPAAAAAGVKAGCDLDCGGAYNALNDAVKQGLISEAEINVSVKRLFTERMRLGMFDPPASVAYSKIPYSVIDSPAHRQLALQAARESIVLLKNDNNTLPLGPKIKSLAVIGPNADDVGVLLGNYNGTPSHAVTALEGLKRYVGKRVQIEHVQGTGLTGLSETATIPTDALTADGRPGLKGEYFAGEDLSGMPKAVRQDAQVRFIWSGSGPGLGLPQFHYSVRWTGDLIAPTDGEYTLAAGGDDGFRLFVNDQKVIDDWGIHPTEIRTATVMLKAGQHVPLRLEYYQGEGDATIDLQWRRPVQTPYADAVAAAHRADAVIFVGGISSKLEGEEGTNGGGDRTSLDLPGVQEKLLEALQATGKPIIFVLMNGSAMSVNWAQAHLPAIVEAWYPGEEGGTALADVLFGDYNPAGRLPVTFYKSVDQLPPFTDYAMKNRTYRYFNGEPLYPFGYGLSYTQFRYGTLKMPRQVKDGQNVTVTAEVENIGPREGDEVSQLYLRPAPDAATRDVAPGQPMPRLILAGFVRGHFAPHQRRTVAFTLTPDQLRLVNAKGERTLQPGAWQVYVGGRQPHIGKSEDQDKDSVSGPLRVQ